MVWARFLCWKFSPQEGFLWPKNQGSKKKISKNCLDFFSIFTGGTLWKSDEKNFKFFFEPRFFSHRKPSWGPLRRFFGEIWVRTTGGPHDFGPEPIWSKWSLTKGHEGTSKTWTRSKHGHVQNMSTPTTSTRAPSSSLWWSLSAFLKGCFMV